MRNQRGLAGFILFGARRAASVGSIHVPAMFIRIIRIRRSTIERRFVSHSDSRSIPQMDHVGGLTDCASTRVPFYSARIAIRRRLVAGILNSEDSNRVPRFVSLSLSLAQRESSGSSTADSPRKSWIIGRLRGGALIALALSSRGRLKHLGGSEVPPLAAQKNRSIIRATDSPRISA